MPRPVLLGAPATARDVLAMLQRCGVNLRGVPDLRGFLEAALLLPRSLTARFDFPQWRPPQPPDAPREPLRPVLARNQAGGGLAAGPGVKKAST